MEEDESVRANQLINISDERRPFKEPKNQSTKEPKNMGRAVNSNLYVCLLITLIISWEKTSMANSDIIVGQISRIDPPLATHAAAPAGRIVQFSDGRTARLDPDNPNSINYGEILDGMRQVGLPVYVELDPETRSVTRLFVPLVVTVRNILPTESGELLVELEISSARHILSPANPDFNRLWEALEDARQHNTKVIVTETDNHEIIDVRPAALQ